MSFLGRLISAGSKFIGRVAPAASYIGRVAPTVLTTTANALNSPLAGMIAQRVGVNPMAMKQASSAITNVNAGLQMLPGTFHDVKSAAQNAIQASKPAQASLANLYRTALGT